MRAVPSSIVTLALICLGRGRSTVTSSPQYGAARSVTSTIPTIRAATPVRTRAARPPAGSGTRWTVSPTARPNASAVFDEIATSNSGTCAVGSAAPGPASTVACAADGGRPSTSRRWASTSCWIRSRSVSRDGGEATTVYRGVSTIAIRSASRSRTGGGICASRSSPTCRIDARGSSPAPGIRRCCTRTMFRDSSRVADTSVRSRPVATVSLTRGTAAKTAAVTRTTAARPSEAMAPSRSRLSETRSQAIVRPPSSAGCRSPSSAPLGGRRRGSSRGAAGRRARRAAGSPPRGRRRPARARPRRPSP